MNDETAAHFVNSVVESLQALCHGYVEFGQSVEIIGHLYLNVDKIKKYNYIVQEQVCKSGTEGSTIFVSNSYYASSPSKKVVPKQQDISETESKFHSNKKSVDYVLFNEQSDTVVQSVLDRENLNAVHDGELTFSSTHSENISHRKRNQISELSRQNDDYPSGPSVENSEFLARDITSHSGPSFSPKAAQRISSNIERALNSGSFCRNENENLNQSANSEKTRKPVSESFSNNSSFDDRMMRVSSARLHQNLGQLSKTVTNESRKRFLKEHSVSQVPAVGKEFSVDLSRVKKESDDAASFCSLQDHEQRVVYHDQKCWNTSNTVDPQDSSSFSGEDECKMDSGTDEENLQGNQDMPQHAPYPLVLHTNTGVTGYGGPVFPQNFPKRTIDQASTSDNDCSMLISSPQNANLHIPTTGLTTGSFNNNPCAPRPGKLSPEVAAKYNMMELSQCRGVYVYPLQITRARNKLSPTACANYLLNCFYTTNELLGSNLTGVNNKKLLDPQIINSILDFVTATFPGAKLAVIKQSIRKKITCAETRAKRKLSLPCFKLDP